MLPLKKHEHLTQRGAWRGNIPIYNVYTLGVAGERFFRELRDTGRLLGTRCKACDLVYMPPRLYCERCFTNLSDSWQEVANRGQIYTYTVAHSSLNGGALLQPEILVLVRLDGAHGGLVHRLREVEPEAVRIGMRVEAALKPPSLRKGSITDIRYFRPLRGRRRQRNSA